MTTYRHTETNRKSQTGVVLHIFDEANKHYTLDFTYGDRGWMAWKYRCESWIEAPELTETFLAVIGEEEVAACVAAAMLKS